MVSNFSQGNLLVYFTGHGSTTVWGKEFIYYSAWVSGVNQLSNGSALPYLLVSSCDSGYFADPRRNAMDEAMLRAAGGGTIGGYTGATFDTLGSQTVLLKEFVRAVMHEGITPTGVAATVAKARMYGVQPYPENERTAMGHGLSGDPALQLAQPASCATGDLNCDNRIDIVDVQQVAGAWNTVAGSIGYNPCADLVPTAVSTSTISSPLLGCGIRSRGDVSRARWQVAGCRSRSET